MVWRLKAQTNGPSFFRIFIPKNPKKGGIPSIFPTLILSMVILRSLYASATGGSASADAQDGSTLRVEPLPDRFRTLIARADPDTARQINDEDLSVSDLSGSRAFNNGIDRRLHKIVINGNFKAYFS